VLRPPRLPNRILTRERYQMKSLVSALALLAWFAAATSPASAKDSDPADLDRCPADMRVGTTCSCKPRLLHPTQMSVGMIQVRDRVTKLKEKTTKKLNKYLENHPEPITIGPGDALYITDHHHLAVALLNMGVEYTYCQIKDNRNNQTMEAFWTGMVSDGKAWPEDAKGVKHSPDAIPASVSDLQDDPYRSLAGAVRRACGFKKTTKDFSEFEWADFFRKTTSPDTGRPITTQLIQTNMDEAVEQAMVLAKSAAAKNLPGYLAQTQHSCHQMQSSSHAIRAVLAR
jgi:hypothetical protein